MGKRYFTIAEIEEVATYLMGKKIKEIDFEGLYDKSPYSKGLIGQIVETGGFGLKKSNDPEPDFKDLQIELKTTGYRWVFGASKVSAKERLVLSIINFMKEVKVDFRESDLFKSLNHILMIFYEYQIGIPEKEFLLSNWYRYVYDNISEKEKLIIENDWNTIIDKIKAGKAHKLSEGDTMYLGACRKGANNQENLRQQPFNEIGAYQRAFSLKTTYMTYLLRERVFKAKKNREQFIKDIDKLREKSLEANILEKFNEYIGKDLTEIHKLLNQKQQRVGKSSLYQYASRMLGLKSANSAEEFVNANLKIKTIRIKKEGGIKESMSFPAFSFVELAETNWDDSDIFLKFENMKYVFVIFKELDDVTENYKLEKVMLWNMPLDDINKYVKPVYKQAHQILNDKLILKTSATNDRISNNFPKHSNNRICHIRPHGTNSYDTYPLPISCEIEVIGPETNKSNLFVNNHVFSKQCFWLSNEYIYNEILKHNEGVGKL